MKRRYELAVDSAQVGLFERPDVQHDKTHWSEKLYELLKIDTSETPEPLISLVHPDYRELMDETRYQLLESHQNTQFTAPLLCGDGEYRWFALNAVVYRDEKSNTVGLSGAVISIDNLKNAETTANREAKLQASVRSLKRINEDLEQFSRMASHDLQEPLRMITSFTELLEEDYAPQLDEQGREYIKFASDGARRMQAMLVSLMEYAKEGRRQAKPVRIDTQALTENVLHLSLIHI